MSCDENVSTSVVDRNLIDDDGINKLTVGLLSLYEGDLVKAKGQLDELTKKQTSVITQLEDENDKLNKMQCTGDLQDMKRAMKLQQMKQKEALQRQHQRELQIQREQELIAKPATSQKKN